MSVIQSDSLELKIVNGLTVAKFGGTSVANYQAMLRCANIIKNDSATKVVVVSASAGVTNYLVRLSQETLTNEECIKLISNIRDIQFNITQHFNDKEKIFVIYFYTYYSIL